MRLCSLLLVALALPGSSAASDLRVLLLLSGTQLPYQSFAKTFRQNLPDGMRVEVLEHPEDYSEKTPPTDLLIAVGSPAAKRAGQLASGPVLYAMVPRNLYEEEIQSRRAQHKSLSALYIDQPWHRQAELLRIAVPLRQRVGVLHSPDTRLDLRALRDILTKHGLTLTARPLRSPDSLFADMEEVLENCDVLLAIPDSAIYNPNTVRNILLSSYRHGIPLVGFSQSYVKAGALYALHSTPEQLAAQASAIASSFAKTRTLPEPQSSRLYSIDVNQDVARTLGISIRSAELLKMQLEETQGKP
jgi:ABC-type uncharacterized transport system substrate-binding protein